jgi:hypothetical protein
MKNIKISEWIVFLFGAGGYIPLIIGGVLHPSEINIATYGLWFVLCSMIAYSSWKQRFAGWFMPFGWVVGQFSIIAVALSVGEYTFNLNTEEMIIFYGIIITLSVWAVVGQQTKKWNPRILFFGGILADILSFYPQIKQYLGPHEAVTSWLVLGWSMFIADMFINLLFVEHLPQKLMAKKENFFCIIESSLLGLENIILLSVTLWLMLR